jgi:predicted nucleotidyltransferase
LDYFQRERAIRKVILFGSRPKRTARYNSDIDLCIDYEGEQKGKIVQDIDDIVGIYSYDVLFADSLNGEIKQQIDRDRVVIYKRA